MKLEEAVKIVLEKAEKSASESGDKNHQEAIEILKKFYHSFGHFFDSFEPPESCSIDPPTIKK